MGLRPGKGARFQTEDGRGDVGEQWYGGPAARHPTGVLGPSADAACGTVDSGQALVPPGGRITPLWSQAGPPRSPHDASMVLLSPHRRADRSSLALLVRRTFIGTVFVAVGLSLAYIAFATPLLHRLLASGRPDTGQTLVGMAIWALALVGPAGCVLLGTSRLARVAAAVREGLPAGEAR